MIPQQLWQHSGHLGKMKGPAQLLSLGLAISGFGYQWLLGVSVHWQIGWFVGLSPLMRLHWPSSPQKWVPSLWNRSSVPKKWMLFISPHTHLCLSHHGKHQLQWDSSVFSPGRERIRNSTPHAKTKHKPLLSSLAESPQPKLCTAERNFQKIKKSTITRNTKINYISEPPYEHDCPCRAHASPDQGSPVNFIGVNEQWCQKTSQKLNKMAELLKIIFTTSSQTFQLPPH